MKNRSFFYFVILFAWILMIMTLTSCDYNYNIDSTDNNKIVYDGTYISTDESILTVTQTDKRFDIIIDIVRLTIIDDGIGDLLAENELQFSATDVNGNPIHGVIYWENNDSVKVEFTNSNWKYLPIGTIFEFYRTDINMNIDDNYIDESNNCDDIPYAPVSFNILESTFSGYKNQTGATFFECSDQNSLAPYYINKLNDVNYYYGTNEVVIGIRNDKICLFTCFASNVVGHTSPLVRELINSLDALSLFEILPTVNEVTNAYNSMNLFYWKVDNGYIGFVTIGGNDPANCYNYVVNSVIIFDNIDFVIKYCNEMASSMFNNVLKRGDMFTISGVVGYSEDCSDIGEKFCFISADIWIEYVFTNIYDVESKYSSNVFYTKEKDTDLLKNYIGQQVTISGVFDTECHGIPYITNVNIIG